MNPAVADSHVRSRAAYVHIPFCRSICHYCAFAVVSGKDGEILRYVDSVVAEIDQDEHWKILHSVYVGGGTPSHVDAALLGRILEALARKHGIAADAEISLEANPEDLDRHAARELIRLGFNRISFGAQSLDAATLKGLGRAHGPGDVVVAFESARSAGFDNISIDLIFGAECETDAAWEETLTRSVALEPDHVSCYALTVEPGTPLARQVIAGASGPDDDVQARRYETAESMLHHAGFNRYEVSNWSRPGRECRYNLIVWAQGEFVGYGMGAHGHRGGSRYRNHRALGSYMKRVEAGESPRAQIEGPMDDWDSELDRVFVGLRRAVGVAPGPGTEEFLGSERGKELIDLGVVSTSGSRVWVSRPLLTDAVHRSVVALTRPIVLADGNARRP